MVDDDMRPRPGLGATASAFQSGLGKKQPKEKKPKQPKADKGGPSSPDQDPSAQKGGGFLSKVKSFMHFKKGGPVKKTGLALLHKGEYVVPATHRSAKKASRKKIITKH